MDYLHIKHKINSIILNHDHYNYYNYIISLHIKHKYILNSINIIKNKKYYHQIKLINNVLKQIDYLHNFKIIKDDYITNVLNDYNQSIKYIQNKNNIELTKTLSNNINEITYLINQNCNKITEFKLLINNNNFIIDNYLNYISMKINYENQIKIYDTLAKSVGIHGIPSIILEKYLKGIQTYMNNLISPFINKTVELILDGNYLYINIYNHKDEIINILGGMEHFIVNISLKITLGKLSVLPKCGLLIIDEGVSVLDKEHIDKFHIIANFLKTNYKNVIIISHVDGIKDFIAHFITINKHSNNDSHIYFN